MSEPGSAAVLGRLMLAFDGRELPPEMAERLAGRPAAGVTLFRAPNVGPVGQLRELTDAIQRLAPPGAPFLVAIDHEGGQLTGLGADATPFPGNMALGATGDPALAERVGTAMGTELLAAGVNVDFAPVADLATVPENPGLGVRSFGDDPLRVAPFVAGLVRGLRSAGVAATLKHFPGLGNAAGDPHVGLPQVDATLDRLRQVELEPFRAGIAAGADLVMSAHVVVPALTGDSETPATLSAAAMRDLLRGELGFDGVTISDAFDMAALEQGPGQVIEALAAMRAGVDLLLLTARSDPHGWLQDALALADARGLLDADANAAALGRIAALRRALPGPDRRASLDAVGSAAHSRLADEVAARSITLVRDEARLLPLHPGDGTSIALIAPRPADLTPADTTAQEPFRLADALRRHHGAVVECLTSHRPTPAEIAAARELAGRSGLVILGTTAATLAPEQVALGEAVLAAGRPVVAVALRMPWDAALLPAAATQVCTYSSVEPSMRALAAALFGQGGFPGRLPVSLRMAGST